MACICAAVSAVPLVLRIEFLILVTPEIPAFISDVEAPCLSDPVMWVPSAVNDPPWQLAQFVIKSAAPLIGGASVVVVVVDVVVVVVVVGAVVVVVVGGTVVVVPAAVVVVVAPVEVVVAAVVVVVAAVVVVVVGVSQVVVVIETSAEGGLLRPLAMALTMTE